MRVIGLKRVALSKLRLPGDFKKYLQDEHVFQLANSISQRGLAIDPLVRQSDWKVCTGLDIVAAHFVRNWQTITTKLMECSDPEFDVIRLEHEVLVKNAASPELTSELVGAYERELAEKSAEDPTLLVSPNKRTRSPKSVAVDKVAALKGVQTGTIKQTLKRVKDKNAPKPPPPILTWGLNLSPKFLDEARVVHEHLSMATAQIHRALGEFTKLSNAGVPFREDILKELRTAVAEAGQAVRKSKPAAVCPACKGVDVLQPRCETCKAFGYLSEGQMDLLFEHWPTLCTAERPMVLVQGKLRPLTDYIPEEPPAQVEEKDESPWY